MRDTKTIQDFIDELEKTLVRIKNINDMAIDLPEEYSIKMALIRNEVQKYGQQ